MVGQVGEQIVEVFAWVLVGVSGVNRWDHDSLLDVMALVDKPETAIAQR